MILVNFEYTNKDELYSYINKNNIQNNDKTLIQIFSSKKNMNYSIKVKNELNEYLPNASIIGTSTAGTINCGKIIDDTVIISFCIFEESTTISKAYSNSNIDFILDDLKTTLIKDNTKLLIAFVNTFSFDSTKLLKKINNIYPKLTIAGGNAGDDFRFEQCHIFSKDLDSCDVAFISINSDVLNVKTNYLFNWQTIGESMIITKAEGSTVFTIDNKKAVDVYEEYLGKNIVNNLLEYGIEFPLIFEDNNTIIGRALIGFDSKIGSITFAGEIPQNGKVQFGFANLESINTKNENIINNIFQKKQEAIFIYTCGSRRQMLGGFLEDELHMINKFGDTSGFITYGEFFHNQTSCSNNLLNITTTFVSLNEKESTTKVLKEALPTYVNRKDFRLNALTTLIAKTTTKLEENIFYLEQFKNAVNESSIFSTANKEGIITNVNTNFEKISGYSKDELIGKPHNIVRHPDISKEKFKELWGTIKSGKSWNGLMKNRNKMGKDYYVLSTIQPVFYKNGKFREYIGIRHDVSELEEYKILLKHELDFTSKNLEENLNYTKQYENAINTSVAIIKTNKNNEITYANKQFLKLSGYTTEELKNMPWKNIVNDNHIMNGDYENILKNVSKGKILKKILVNKGKNSRTFTSKSIFYPITFINGEIIETLHVINNITDIINLNREIEDTQKEVVLTMGAIGETRSKETGLHVKRVAEYSYLLAILYGLTQKKATLLKQASPMHDIGKVGIPDSILNKPGKLTFDEFEIMKTHAQLGYEMLKHSKREILKTSAIVAHEHHEKWDGSGYPRGLKGEDIHIYGRITAIADVFDALGNDRIYKKAWELDKILELFQEQKNKQFDPFLVELFFNNLDKFLKIRDELKD